jgi:hypothetical protein
MNHVHTEGTFVRFGGETFRTEGRLYFRGGDGKDLLLIGMNPGSCLLAHGKEKELKQANEGEYVTGEIVMDKTMQHIVQMMDKACPSFKGTLYIINLFNVRCGNMGAAIKRYVALLAKKSFEPYLLTDIKEYSEARAYTAVWLAWSLRDESNINKRKRQVKRIFDPSRDKRPISPSKNLVAKFKGNDPSSIHVWHFKPLLDKHAIIYRNDVIPLLRNILNGSSIDKDEVIEIELSLSAISEPISIVS